MFITGARLDFIPQSDRGRCTSTMTVVQAGTSTLLLREGNRAISLPHKSPFGREYRGTLNSVTSTSTIGISADL